MVSLDPSKAISVGIKLVLITNRKSHMNFRLVPKSVTLNDLEQHLGRSWSSWPLFCIISANSIAFRVCYVNVVEDIPKLSTTEM